MLGVLQLHSGAGEPFDEFDRLLFGNHCQHAAVALNRVRRIEALNRRRSFQASLQVAREIQRGFMPSRMPPISGYEAATWWMANEAVGGDYCDVIRLKDHCVALTIADVSGHGLGPSLIMAAVRAALHALVLEHTEPEVLLNLLGRSLSQDLSSERFITMALGVLDPVDHSVQYANAGHAPALHFEAATGEFIPLESTGMPLGVVDRPAYHQGWPFTLDVGDLVVFCTDGIVEALDSHDRPFGRTQLETIVRKTSSLPVAQIVSRVGEAVQDHYGGGSPPDDLTLLTVRRNA
jgi:phosphoserine phosphatase